MADETIEDDPLIKRWRADPLINSKILAGSIIVAALGAGFLWSSIGAFLLVAGSWFCVWGLIDYTLDRLLKRPKSPGGGGGLRTQENDNKPVAEDRAA